MGGRSPGCSSGVPVEENPRPSEAWTGHPLGDLGWASPHVTFYTGGGGLQNQTPGSLGMKPVLA